MILAALTLSLAAQFSMPEPLSSTSAVPSAALFLVADPGGGGGTSPGTACAMSCLLPGLGQFWDGRPAEGLIFFGAMVLSTGLGSAFTAAGLRSVNDGLYIAGGVFYAIATIVWVWAMIDAYTNATGGGGDAQ